MTGKTSEREWRFVDTGASDGFTNMSIDEAMLHAHEKGMTPPTLRVYEWTPPALSVGYFQSIAKDVDEQECLRNGIHVVRRKTGGRSVLHKDELTYSVVASGGCGLPRDLIGSYRAISQGLIAAYRILGLKVHLAPHRGNHSAAACFNASSFSDLTCRGRKIAGSAQFRRDDVLLQHGSLPISLDARLFFSVLRFPSTSSRDRAVAVFGQRATCIADMLGRSVSLPELKEALFQGFQEAFGIRFHVDTLSSYEVNLGRVVAEQKYSDSARLSQDRHEHENVRSPITTTP